MQALGALALIEDISKLLHQQFADPQAAQQSQKLTEVAPQTGQLSDSKGSSSSASQAASDECWDGERGKCMPSACGRHHHRADCYCHLGGYTQALRMAGMHVCWDQEKPSKLGHLDHQETMHSDHQETIRDMTAHYEAVGAALDIAPVTDG